MKQYKITQKDIDLLKEDVQLLSDGEFKNWAMNYLVGHINHYNGILKQFNKAVEHLQKVEKILEVGAVPCQLTVYLKQRQFNIDIIDLDPNRVKPILDKHNILSNKLDIEVEDFPIENCKYDLVLFNEVFEHLRNNPLRSIAEIYRVLKPGGLLLMSVPNINPLMRWQFLFGQDFNDDLDVEFAKIKNIGHMGHFRLYSKGEVDRLLTNFNFELIDYSFDGNMYNKSSKLLSLFKMIFGNRMRNQYHVIARKF